MVNVREIENRMRLRFLENYEFIMEKIPTLRKKLQKEGNLDWRVVVEDDGSINAFIGGKKIYAYDAKKLCKEQVETFKSKPKRLVVPLFELEGTFGTTVHEKYMTLLQKRLFSENRRMLNEYKYDNKNVPLMLVFGVGLGFHLIELIRTFNIQHMIAIELNPDIFRMSLSTIDWREIYDYFSKNGRTFTLIVSENFKEAKRQLIDKLMLINGCFYTYMFIFEHFEHETYKRLFDWMVQEIAKQPLTWGFFDDEVWSIEHTFSNVKQNIPVFAYMKKLSGNEIPVFVVGSGPSLDKSISAIERNKDKALIISCGTGLAALYKKGITPDIHVEIERTKATYEYLCEIDKRFLKKITIVGFNNLYPKVFKLGKRNFMALKANDAGALFFPKEFPHFFNSNPTVTAFGVALAAYLGFKNIYLFGVDLGVLDKEYHHSKLSPYFSEKSVVNKFPGTPLEYGMEVEGFTTDKAYTNIYLYNTKISIENTIEAFKINAVSVEGVVRIENTSYKSSNDIDFHQQVDKNSLMKAIYSSFTTSYSKYLKPDKALNKLREDFKLYLNIALQIIDKAAPSVEGLMKVLSELHLLYIDLTIGGKIGIYIVELLRGSITTMTKYMIAGAFSEADVREFVLFCYNLIKSFLKEALNRVEAMS